MKRVLLIAIWVTSSSSAAVLAQTLTLRVTAIDGPGGARDNATEIAGGLNLADCVDPAAAEITVHVDEALEEGLDLWVSLDGECETTASRTGDAATCFDIGEQVDDLEDGELSVGLDQLAAGDIDACATTTSGGATLHLHAFDSGLESTTGELAEIPRGSVELEVDPVPPDAPEIVSGDGSGATAVGIEWDAPTDGDAAELDYRLVGEAAGVGCADGDVALREGRPAPRGAVELASVTGATAASVNPSLDSIGLEDGEGMLVGVVATDPAGNAGEVSNLVCVTREPTAGYCDVLTRDGDASCASGCAAGGGGATPAAVLPLLLVVGAVRRRRGAGLLVVCLVLLVAGTAAAEGRPNVLTLGAGVQRPDGVDAFGAIFGDEAGPLVGAELSIGLWRVPRVGWVSVGLGAGWAAFSGRTCRRDEGGAPDCSAHTSERASLTLLPMTALATLRVDTLARELGVPVVVTPKIGLESIYYWSKAGALVDGEGLAHGLRWAVEVALELDGLDLESTQALRRDAGIEHAFVFVQGFGSVGQSRVVADSLAWTAGLGFSF